MWKHRRLKHVNVTLKQKNSQWMNVSDFKLFIDNPPPKKKNKSRDFNRSNSPFQKDCFFLEGRKVEHVETLLILILIHLDYHNLSLVKNNLVKWITTSIWRYLAGISTWHLMKVVPQKLIVACCLRMETVSWYFHILASLINKRNPSKKKHFVVWWLVRPSTRDAEQFYNGWSTCTPLTNPPRN